MRISRRAVFIVIAGIMAFASAGERLYPGEAITWHSYNAGMLKAKQLKKPVLVDFYASWCHWCKVMDKETFSNQKVIRKLRSDYIPIRLDMESEEVIQMGENRFTARDFASMLGVSGLPTVAFFERSGKLITMVPGYVQVDTMLPLLNYIGDECYKSRITFKDYMEKKKSCGK